jgi:hypothetical protein
LKGSKNFLSRPKNFWNGSKNLFCH